jgi:hypothetical protein
VWRKSHNYNVPVVSKFSFLSLVLGAFASMSKATAIPLTKRFAMTENVHNSGGMSICAQGLLCPDQQT